MRVLNSNAKPFIALIVEKYKRPRSHTFYSTYPAALALDIS